MKGSLHLAAAAALLVGGTGFACTRSDNRAANDQNRDQTAMASPSPTSGAYGSTADNTKTGENQPSAGDIAGNPAKYAGQHVTLKADVKKVLPNGSFTLADNDLLVVGRSMQRPNEKENVTVSGTVETYSAPELKKKYSWFRSNNQMDTQYKDRPVIVADSITTADGRELVSGSALPAGTGEVGTKNKNSKHHNKHGEQPAPPPQQ